MTRNVRFIVIAKVEKPLVVAVALLLVLALQLSGQVRPVYDRGATGLIQALKRLNTSASVLMIGAHPDDEDTALLAYLARGENARTGYLSLTRGDGGQNIIGSELGEALGVIRTEELLQARRLDGAEQFFTRAYDFGFSKTLAEAKSKWPEQTILCDAVRVIRSFRPLVVVSQFSGTSADGHGQHQFAGYLSPIAVKAAADPAQCQSAGAVWTVKKFYARHRGAGEARLRINTGKFDPVLGRSYFEIAMEARSQHKSQEQGVLELRGEQFSGLNLIGSEAKEAGIFDGLDLSLNAAMAGASIQTREALKRAANLPGDVSRPVKPDNLLPYLAMGYSLTVTGEKEAADQHMRAFFRDKRRQFVDAMVLAGGVQIDALADRETVVPGESVSVGVKAYTAEKDLVKFKKLRLVADEGWTVEPAEAPKNNTPAFVAREIAAASAFFTLTPSRSVRPTEPYWLADPRAGDLFSWSREPESHTLPMQRSPVRLEAVLEILGIEIVVDRPIEYRFADDVRGEIRRNLTVVSVANMEMDQPLVVVPSSDKPQTRSIVMTVTNHSQKPISGVASLDFDGAAQWRYSATPRTFNLKRTGEKAATRFEVTIPAKTRPGKYLIDANVMMGEEQANQTMKTIAYPHIQTQRFYRRATVEAVVVDLKTAPVKVGYIVGSGDRVPDAIRQMGFNLEIISEGELANGRLSRFDTIVVGIRAYQVRPDVVANNQRLLDYVGDGGNLVVQYQLPAYAQAGLTPFPATMGPRVADENAAVKIAAVGHPVLNFPNKIGESDFLGWVQERNLYNFTSMAPEYTGLLESHDAGEPENVGGLVVAQIGKGTYVYCSYSMFRQLPAGVGGAYRLFANLLSLPSSKK